MIMEAHKLLHDYSFRHDTCYKKIIAPHDE